MERLRKTMSEKDILNAIIGDKSLCYYVVNGFYSSARQCLEAGKYPNEVKDYIYSLSRREQAKII